MKTVGILGGLGPESTVDFYQKMIDITVEKGAKTDQDHIPVIISCIPQTPDRTEAIHKKVDSPLLYFIRSARRLQGADFIVLICNTAHYYAKELQEEVDIPLLHMMETVAQYIKDNHDATKIGILGTEGTIETELYQRELTKRGLTPIIPDRKHQRKVTTSIYGKNGIKTKGATADATKLLKDAAGYLVNQGAEAIILGCTEIPLALIQEDVDILLFDANYILAEAAVKRALK